MASKRSTKSKDKITARLVVGEKKLPCAFCNHKADDEIIYGKLYAIGDIQCHYFCVLLSCCLVQKGRDSEGLLGFLYHDIIAEVERSKKHRCSYCGRGGATLGCSISQCRKQFHLPCGRERNAISLFYDNYKSFCMEHAPKQQVPESIMSKARLRMPVRKKKSKSVKTTAKNLDTPAKKLDCPVKILHTPTIGFDTPEKHLDTSTKQDIDDMVAVTPEKICNLVDSTETMTAEAFKTETEFVCVICYEEIDGYPSTQTFWPPCCARDAWFHRNCLERMALSAGMHYLKCPLCNDKENFYRAVISQGYYVPDRDAAWELEQNAFSEIYERQVPCNAVDCHCPMGREHDADTGTMWDIKICLLCGSTGVHAYCLQKSQDQDEPIGLKRYVCKTCQPAAPVDLEQLETDIAAVMLTEQPSQSQGRRSGPVMPSRMSLRRTKQRILAHSASMSHTNTQLHMPKIEPEDPSIASTNTTLSREELNLKPPKRQQNQETILKGIENTFASPMKLLEQTLKEKMSKCNVKAEFLNQGDVVEILSKKIRKPRPLCVKKKIVSNFLEKMFTSSLTDFTKTKEPIREWNSPKKSFDVEDENQKVPDTIPHKMEKSFIDAIKSDPCDYITPQKTKDKVEIKTNEKENIKGNTLKLVENTSENVFRLPVDLIPETSTGNLPIFETPKKLKTVEIEKDSSMEISENNEVINVDLIKIEENSQNKDFITNLTIKSPLKTKKCAFKFSPIDKETLQKNNVNIDLESFKNQYLNEVDREFKCNFSHNHKNDNHLENFTLKTAIDFALDAAFRKDASQEIKNDQPKNLKRKRKCKKIGNSKRRKLSDSEKYAMKYKKPERKLKIKCSKDIDINKLKENSDRKEKLKKEDKRLKKKIKTKFSIKDKNIQVKIKWKEEQLKLKITQSHKRVARQNISPQKSIMSPSKTLKQYVLKYSPDISSSKELIAKPEMDVTPLKKKKIKQEMLSDNLVQTSIQNFFKIKLPTSIDLNVSQTD